MYFFLSALAGCMIAVMVAFNGALCAQYGVLASAAIIHLVGVGFALAALRLRGAKLGLSRSVPPWLYLGGAIGVLTTLCNNFAFGKISVTSIVALGLLGQTLAALFIDRFGLMGMPKRPFSLANLPGLACAGAGMALMLDYSEGAALPAVLFSLAAGVAVVLSRTVNAGLSARVGALQGSFINHLTGLPITVALLLLFGRGEPLFAGAALSPKLWIYLGGALGVVVVLLFNLTVPKLQAVQLTFLSFAGQALTGVLIDGFGRQGCSRASFTGGALVAAGVLLNLLLSYWQKKRAARNNAQRP